jgi:hypothetical protein
MSSSSRSSESETIDFYSDITQNGVDGGDDSIVGGVNKSDVLSTLTWGIIVVSIIALILGITIWQLESNVIITYKEPTSTTAKWLSSGLMISGGVVLLLTAAGKGYMKFKSSDTSGQSSTGKEDPKKSHNE